MARLSGILFHHLIKMYKGTVMLRRHSFLRSGLFVLASAVLTLPAWAGNAQKSTWQEKPQSETSSQPGILKLPVKGELLVLDGQSVTDLDLKKNAPLKLAAGRHQVVFRLSDIIKSGGDRDVFTTKPFILSFHPVNGRTYEIQAPRLQNLKQAEAINNNPAAKISLVNDREEEVPFEMAALNVKGMQIGRNLAVDVKRFNRTSDSAAVPEFSGVEAEQTFTGFTGIQQDPKLYGAAASTAAEDMAMSENMLRYWFEKSDPQTRLRFLEWANKQK